MPKLKSNLNPNSGTGSSLSDEHRPSRISYERWIEQYRPVKNQIDNDAPFDGYMFETYGEELQFVKGQAAAKIWTLLDCDGKTRLCEGFHFVNRIGYFVTEVEAPAHRSFSIVVD